MSKSTVRLDASVPKFIKDVLFFMARRDGMSASEFLSVLVMQEYIIRLKMERPSAFDSSLDPDIPF